MKKFTLAIFLVSLIISGCNQENSINEPELTSAKLKKSNVSWFSIPQNITELPDGSTQSSNYLSHISLFSERIRGEKGGDIDFEIKEDISEKVEKKIKGKIKFPKRAFKGEQDISVVVDNTTATVTFAPHPYYFDESLEYTIEYEGLNLTGFNPEDFDFYYLAEDGTLEPVEYKKIKVDIEKGKLKVEKAKINHFSRYGWVKRH